MKQANNDKAMLKKTKKSAGVAFFIVLILAAILIIRIIAINVVNGEEYSQKVLNGQAYSQTEIKASRGSILDRNGTVLAYSKKVYNLILDPYEINANPEDKDTTVAALVSEFDVSKDTIESKLADKNTSRYEKLAEQISQEQADEFTEKMKEAGNIVGVWFEDTYKRVYPFSTLASDTVGFYEENNGGVLGLERYYDNELTGTSGLKYTYIDENMDTQNDIKTPVNGNDIVTTLDYGAQNIIEEVVADYNKDKPSANTGVILMDPDNGEVLSMASWPTFDLNNPRALEGEYTEEERSDKLSGLWKNFCISQVYEPGSTFKSIVVAGALEEGVANDGDMFFCRGFVQILNYRIGCWRHSGHGSLDLAEGLGDSCNMVLIQLGEKLNKGRLIKYQEIFGIGSKTEIDLPAEERGILQDEDKMSEVDLATNSFGQNFNVTMIQMAAAYCALVNGGDYYQPHIVKEIKNQNGETLRKIEGLKVRQTITPETSDLIRGYLKKAVDEYTVKTIKVDGYAIGGKTGTAEKIPRSDKKWVVSVASFAPVDDPRFVLYVVVDEPYGTTGTSGSGEASATMTKRILERLLKYYGIPRTEESKGTTSDGPISDDGGSGEINEAAGVADNASSSESEQETEAQYFNDEIDSRGN